MTRSFATFGILIGGAVSLASGAALLATLARRSVPGLFVIFLVAIVVTGGSMIAFLLAELNESRAEPEE